MSLIFANHQQFELTCRKFIERQTRPSDDLHSQDILARVQSGWKWHDHPVYPHQGYLYRKDVKSSRIPDSPSSLADTELDEEEIDAAIAPSPFDERPAYISVEWMVVFSKTYRIPQLCFNVYDGTGNPLSLSDILLTGSILLSPLTPDQVHDDYLDLPSDDNFDAGAQFPILQRISHPYPHIGKHTAFEQTVLSVHPCHVQDTVAEILASSKADKNKSVRTVSSMLDERETDAEESLSDDQLQSLDCWFMVTSTLINLRP